MVSRDFFKLLLLALAAIAATLYGLKISNDLIMGSEPSDLHILIIFGLISLTFSCLGFHIYLNFSSRHVIDRAVREETGERHAAKRNIPDMGGIVMLIVYAILFPFVHLWTSFYFGAANSIFWIFYLAPIALGLLGLTDDIIKSRRKNTRGLRALFRLPLQFLAAVIIALAFNSFSGTHGFFYGIWIIIFIVGTINAANFTDGLDGLLTGCSMISLFCLIIFSGALTTIFHGTFVGTEIFYLAVPFFIMLAFLFYNYNPAKIFMGDCGSMFIGAFLALFAILTEKTGPFVVMAFPIYFSLISVVLQVVSFRTTGKRIFPMTPFHHSFEKWGWKERRIVNFYYLMSLIFGIPGYIIYSVVRKVILYLFFPVSQMEI